MTENDSRNLLCLSFSLSCCDSCTKCPCLPPNSAYRNESGVVCLLLCAICLSVRACVFACRPLMNLNDVCRRATLSLCDTLYMLAGCVSNDGRAAEQPGFLQIHGLGENPSRYPCWQALWDELSSFAGFTEFLLQTGGRSGSARPDFSKSSLLSFRFPGLSITPGSHAVIVV